MVSNVTPKFMKGKYSGQSNGQKPADVQNGSVYFEVDTGKYYMYDAEGKRWYEQKDNGSGTKPKPEQEKTVDITSNGTVVVEPDAGSVLSKVTANVNVQSGGGECEAMLDGIIDRSITEIRNDRVKSIGNYAFQYLPKLTTADFPAVTSIGVYVFYQSFSLTTADFPVATKIGGYVFSGCSALTTLRLSGPTLCNATGNPKINRTCKIYVPASLIEQYKSATNWSQYASQFVAIEGV